MSDLIRTGKVRFSFCNVFEPSAMNGGDARYSVTLLIPKSDITTHTTIVNAMNDTLKDATASVFGGVAPANPKLPLYDGDGLRPSGEPFGAECKGHWVITANSKQKPGIVDKDVNRIMAKEEFYSGCYGRATLRFYAYNKNGNKGIGCGLGNLQKLEDGEALSGRTKAEDDFADSVSAKPAGYAVDPITGQPV